MLKYPEQMQRFKSNPALLPSVVEETLRFESSLQRLGRTVLKDTVIAGTPIKAGDTLLMLIGSANRDPAQFSNPEEFDIARKDNKHIAFGTGVHFCLGAPLARLEAPIALGRLFNRFENLALQQERVHWNSGAMRGLKELIVGKP
jgi:hypothetical protein